MKAIIMMSIRWAIESDGQKHHDVEQMDNLLGVEHKAVVTSNQSKKIFTGTRENFALRGLNRISQISTLFYSTEAKW